MTIAMQPIYTQTVGSGGASSITFNNIPQYFTDLMIVFSARNTTSGTTYVNFLPNNDTSAVLSYTYVDISPAAGTAYSGRSTGANFGFFSLVPNNASSANTFNNGSFYIANYSGNQYKQIISETVMENNSVGTTVSVSPNVFLWSKTSAISSLVISDRLSSGNIAQYSTFTLYGITKG